MHTKLLADKKLAIIGGGPGGLTLARLLQQKGVDVKVYERDMDRTARIQGGALDLHDNSGLAALKAAGLLEAFKNNFRPGAEKIKVLDQQARVFLDEHTSHTTRDFGDKYYRPEIDRGPLRDILLGSLQPGTVVWNSHITSLEPVGEQWQLNFADGHSVIAGLVVGADGSSSKIRPYVTGEKPMWVGVTMIEGSMKDSANTAPNIYRLLQGGKIFAYGNEQTLIVSSKGDGNFGFMTSLKTGENWVKESGIDFKDNRQLLSWFKKEFSGWSKVWQELFESEKTEFIPRPQYTMPLNLRWSTKNNITLIGDAAHWMPPFAGEGVNMAMLDALQLSECITNDRFQSIHEALECYEKKMFKRFAKAGQATLFNTEWMHQPKALNTMLAMFGKNILKKIGFVSRMWGRVNVVPIFQKHFGSSKYFSSKEDKK